VGLAVWGLLYSISIFSDEHELRIKGRVRKYLLQRDEQSPQVSVGKGQSAQRAPGRLARLDSKWEDRAWHRAMQIKIQAAGLEMTPTELVLWQLGVGAGLALIPFALLPAFGLLLAPFAMLAGVFILRIYLRHATRRRIARFEDQLPDTLAVLAGSVRSGFSLFQALQMISREATEPSKTEFTRIIQDISLGTLMSDALEGLAQRIPTEDVDILVTAIAMQQQSGGNLTHVLDVVAHTVRERHRVKRDIKSLTAQQRFSAVLLSALPFLLGAVLFVISPKYLGHLFQWGWVLCIPARTFVMTVTGFFVMSKMADIDV